MKITTGTCDRHQQHGRFEGGWFVHDDGQRCDSTVKPDEENGLPSLDGFEVYAYVGEDEFGSGEIGLKQARVPAGMIPIVAVRRAKIDQDYIREQLQRQATEFGKSIRLVRLVYAETIVTLDP